MIGDFSLQARGWRKQLVVSARGMALKRQQRHGGQWRLLLLLRRRQVLGDGQLQERGQVVAQLICVLLMRGRWFVHGATEQAGTKDGIQ